MAQIATQLLDYGLLPAVRHVAAAGLVIRDAVVVPATATEWLQAAQRSMPPPFKTTGGLDLRVMDRYRAIGPQCGCGGGSGGGGDKDSGCGISGCFGDGRNCIGGGNGWKRRWWLRWWLRW
ncbi:hypothetical protein Vretifemale_266 [Volvox reticuliferus]|uniref:Uncharacterized protein n=1 Tax=Volvox reticuliferus TaxID=1737510 RepID=A0A8J4FF03_9CHLO|nr:hypothetical protein Vretifemale_266 [Volvox reticuliferus]